jgi:hypothetical protein
LIFICAEQPFFWRLQLPFMDLIAFPSFEFAFEEHLSSFDLKLELWFELEQQLKTWPMLKLLPKIASEF